MEDWVYIVKKRVRGSTVMIVPDREVFRPEKVVWQPILKQLAWLLWHGFVV
jgi:hypothetical protein